MRKTKSIGRNEIEGTFWPERLGRVRRGEMGLPPMLASVLPRSILTRSSNRLPSRLQTILRVRLASPAGGVLPMVAAVFSSSSRVSSANSVRAIPSCATVLLRIRHARVLRSPQAWETSPIANPAASLGAGIRA
jgi:hypothetical protein